MLSIDVCYYAKIRILKQITTDELIRFLQERCLLLCKDKNFKANHNPLKIATSDFHDVCYYAKIRILKQITTSTLLPRAVNMMFVTMQR